MKTQAVKEVDKLLTEVLPPTPLTPETLAALVVDALGRVTAVITRAIEGAENHEQAFARLVDAEVGRQLHQCAAAFGSARRAIELARATR